MATPTKIPVTWDLIPKSIHEHRDLHLLSLSDELLLNIVQNLDRHTDVPSVRLVCHKLNDLTETYFYRNVMITLPEEIIDDKWQLKLRLMPPQISKAKKFTVLNQRQPSTDHFYTLTICQPSSYRILRWNLLEERSAEANTEFAKAACLAGVQFYPNLSKFGKRQLTAFRWRHAMPLSLKNLTTIIDKQARSLEELEISMIAPPKADGLRDFKSAIRHKKFPKLRSFKYHGLSHTEPLAVNRPEKGGRSRMLRPLFQKFHETLEELLLSQDHCISQVGKTPMTLGRTWLDTRCTLDDLYVNPPRASVSATEEQPPITLKLTKLELGGFRAENLFDTPTVHLAVPQVRLNLSLIQRLVLNNCFGVESLFQKLPGRRDEIQNLKEFGLRVEHDSYVDDLSEMFVALRNFLLCFKGLEVLSVLVDGDAADLRIGKDILTHHAKTLRAYSVAARNHLEDPDSDITLTFVSLTNYGEEEQDDISPGVLTSPPPLREYGTFLNKVIGGEYARLRYLSQFPELRTVVIRNFPPPSKLSSTVLGHENEMFWRDSLGYVSSDFASDFAVRTAERFAEQIALPFCALPSSYPRSEGRTEDSLPFPDGYSMMMDRIFSPEDDDMRIVSELQEIADTHHTAARDRLLGFTPKTHSSSPTPKTDPTRDILKQKAQVDPYFCDVMRKVEAGAASPYESDAFESYEALVKTAFGLAPPPEESKPKLKLLVIGDWTYRDQMNITGPRRWDPTAWASRSHTHDCLSEDSADGEDSQLHVDIWNHRNYHWRPEFKKQFDVGLLPIFFAIKWEIHHDKDRGRYKWRAKAFPMEQTTLEGEGALSDTRLLDFAWRM